MREGEPSRTAFGAACHRAVHQVLDPVRVFEDPLALRILGPSALQEQVVEEARERGPSGLRLFIAVRHRFAEDSLNAAVSRGTRQVVVLGAGLDTLAYRNPHAGTRVWEVDFPATQQWKRAKLAEAGIEEPGEATYVGVDFERQELLPALAAAGLEPTSPTFFLWLGVVPYLTHEATRATLGAIGSIPGGEVVCDYAAPTPDADGGVDDVRRRELVARVAAAGEPFADPWDPGALHTVLRGCGLSEVEDLDRTAVRGRYLGLAADGRAGGAHVVRARRPQPATRAAAGAVAAPPRVSP